MHIPDGFLDAKTFGTLYGVSAAAVGFSIFRLKKILGEKQVPLIGVVSAFVFAAQMLNFPVAGGTSGHFTGGVLSAVLLGPSAGLLVMATVIMVQCFVFQDGGITALGANVFNMGLLGSVAGYYIFLGLRKFFNLSASVFTASWISIIIAASSCAVELAVSGTVPLKVSLIAMVSVHTIIGLGEGLITVAVISFISKVRPDILDTGGMR
ncbi:MAG: energy-coupling factor ABC transporter permease [Elusimicrobiota bacterium]|nr:energy-coupling factor ABC transporter permease [Elusimicrobiota bacterium]